MYNDNRGAILIAKNSASASRTRHLKLRYFFVNECIEDGVVEIEHKSSEENIADGFTKSLRRSKFEQFREKLFN